MNYEIRDRVCSFENLYHSMMKCKKGVIWKDSVAGYVKNGLVNCRNLKKNLTEGKYSIDKYTIFKVYEPKERTIVSTRIKDRVFQRSLCDNYLTEAVSRSFIYDNCACQLNKGTDFARNRLKCHLQRFYRKHGTRGYVLKCDLTNFFGSTPHEVAKAAIRKRVDDEWVIQEVDRIIDSFNQGEDPNIGLGLGSQVTQLVENAVLDDLDHYIKEKLRIKCYVRYMDDFILIHEDKEHLKMCRCEIEKMTSQLGLQLSKKKTQLFQVTQPIRFLGFSFRLTETGKVVMRILPNKVTEERRRLRKMVQKSKEGKMPREKVDDCIRAWKAHASKGNSDKLIEAMEQYYRKLWR